MKIQNTDKKIDNKIFFVQKEKRFVIMKSYLLSNRLLAQ